MSENDSLKKELQKNTKELENFYKQNKYFNKAKRRQEQMSAKNKTLAEEKNNLANRNKELEKKKMFQSNEISTKINEVNIEGIKTQEPEHIINKMKNININREQKPENAINKKNNINAKQIKQNNFFGSILKTVETIDIAEVTRNIEDEKIDYYI